MKIFYLIVFIFILPGCVAQSDLLQVWVGKTESELVSSLGAPDKVFTTIDGKRVLTWNISWSGCTHSYTILHIGQDTIIEKGSHQNCPKYALSFSFLDQLKNHISSKSLIEAFSLLSFFFLFIVPFLVFLEKKKNLP